MFNIIDKKRLLRLLGNIMIVPLVNVLCKTLNIHEVNKPNFNHQNSGDENFVFAFWHGTMLAPWYSLKESKPCAIISKSRDGDLLAKLLIGWKYNVKRGSSSRDGKLILNELVHDAKNNESIAITPDGPRGPERVMKAGAVVISKKSQVPIILIGVYNKRRLKLKSWDKFEIPYFFSTVNMVYSKPINIDEKLTYEETDEVIKRLSLELNKLQEEAERKC